MKIEYKKLNLEEIPDFNRLDTLYVSDFRALGEELFMEIPEMRKYENLIKWLSKEGYLVLNEWEKDNNSLNQKVILINNSPESRRSTFDRLKDIELPKSVKRIWVAIPHPDSDLLALEKNLKVNYKYNLFDKLNDKLLQKKALGDLTPPYKTISNFNQLKKVLAKDDKYFLKKRQGSGGFTSFDCSNKDIREITKNEFVRKYLPKREFFLEKKIDGTPWSVQIFKDKDHYIIFGFTKQLFDEGGFFKGNIIYEPEMIENKKFIEKVLSSCNSFLKRYNGFFGIDYIQDKSARDYVLELNVRLTAATIPTLISNSLGYKESEYLENSDKASEDDIILTEFKEENSFDILKKIR